VGVHAQGDAVSEPASHLLWRACGSPPSPKASTLPTDREGDWSRCWVCAGETHGRGCGVADWDGANFTGQSRVRYPAGQAICEPCLWVMARNSEVPIEGNGNWRNYSVLYAHGEPLLIRSKGDKPAVLAWLRRPHAPPWFAALAESGQKHVVPYVPVNGRGRARALFDERLIDLPSDAGAWSLCDEMAALLTAGATKEEIDGGRYAGALTRCRDAVRAFEARHGAKRGSGFFVLCLFLAQRDEAAVEARMKREAEARAERKAAEKAAAKASKPAPVKPAKTTKTPTTTRAKKPAKEATDHGRSDARDPHPGDGGVPARSEAPVPRDGREPAQALGPDDLPAQPHPADVRVGGGDGDAVPARPARGGAVQGLLFGDPEPPARGERKRGRGRA
jgi:hypothetical protein